jgi:sporulation integral membrane protein YlbJ
LLSSRKCKAYILAFFSVFIIGVMTIYPGESMQAALRGVGIWWEVLFPALFPFFVISELLLGFGIVHFFGTILDPMMRPLFRVPGIGGFVLAMGFASGYPVGARLSAQLTDQRLIDRDEGERLVAFTTTSDPIFLIGAVAVGFFHDVSLAVVFAVSHYGAALIIGLLMRFHGGVPKETHAKSSEGKNKSIIIRSFKAMHKARMDDGRPLGLLLKQAIENSIRMVFIIGGLVVFFSVMLELAAQINILRFFYILVNSLLGIVGIPQPLSESFVNGLIEVTLGAKTAGEAAGSIPLVYKVAAAAFILSWSGLSVHAQVMSLLNGTGIRYGPFLLARFIHGIISTICVFIIWRPIQPIREKFKQTVPSFHPAEPGIDTVAWIWTFVPLMWMTAIASIVFLYVIFLLIRLARRVILK